MDFLANPETCAGKLPKERRTKARQTGLMLDFGSCVATLFSKLEDVDGEARPVGLRRSVT